MSRREFFEYQFEGARGSLETMRKYIDIQDKEMLDIGCGYGGASTFFAINGLRVTAVDNQSYEDGFLADAINFAIEKEVGITFCFSDAHKLPFKTNSIDIIRLDSVLEHLETPETVLAECRRVLKTGGLLFISFPLFYSPYGGHTVDYLKIPWLHTLPSTWVRRLLRQHKSKPGMITTDYVEKLYLSLNKMTLKRYKRIIKEVSLEEISYEEAFYMPHDAVLFFSLFKKSIRCRSFNGLKQAFIHYNFTSVLIFAFLFFLYRLPVRRISALNEIIVSGIRSVLRC